MLYFLKDIFLYYIKPYSKSKLIESLKTSFLNGILSAAFDITNR